MSNSSLVVYKKISPNKNVNRKYAIDRISVHCVVGQVTAESLGDWFARTSTQASSNYGIDKNGRVGMYVEEKDRSWCTSSSNNDNRAVTIECASDTTYPYAFKDVVYKKLIELCADICKRNGKTKLIWFNDKNKALNYKPASNEMVITVHRWFASTECPGDWAYSRLGDLAKKVNAKLGNTSEKKETTKKPVKQDKFKSYKVKVSINNLNIRKGPGTNYSRVGYIPVGIYTIIQESSGKGATKWGKLKSGAGWISLDYISKV